MNLPDESDSSLNGDPTSSDAVQSAIDSPTELLASSSEMNIDQAVLERLTQSLPAEDRQAILTMVQRTVSHSGWLPPPSMLREYEEAFPGLAERIVAMPEREQAYRHRVTEKMQHDDYALKRWGQNLAIGALILLLLFSGFLAWRGDVAWAGRVAIGTIVGVIGIFVTGKWADVKAGEQSDKDDESD